MVREEDRTISVSVKGQGKTHYITELRATLNEIFESYKSDPPKLQYRIERHGEIPDALETKNPLWLRDSKILNQSNDNVPYYDDITIQSLELSPVVNIYHITADTLLVGGQGHQVLVDQSTHNTFNFYECNIDLQGYLNELAQGLTEAGEKKAATELKNTAKALEQLEQCDSTDEIKKNGIINRLKRLIEALEDNGSRLNKTVKGITNGIKIAKYIAKRYNAIAEWIGCPQVPKPLL